MVGELHPKSGGGVFCVGNAENGQATSRDVGYAAGNKSNSVFQSNGRSEARMVMKTGGRYRRDNIPRGRVSRSRRCQRRQARPRRRRIVAAKPTAPRHLSHSLVPRSRSCVTRVPATAYVRLVRLEEPIFLLVFPIVLRAIMERIARA